MDITVVNLRDAGLNEELGNGSFYIKLQKKMKGKKDLTKTFFGNKQEVRRAEIRKKCELCGKEHGIWNSDTFKVISAQQRWEVAKQLKLCFSCLRKDAMDRLVFEVMYVDFMIARVHIIDCYIFSTNTLSKYC